MYVYVYVAYFFVGSFHLLFFASQKSTIGSSHLELLATRRAIACYLRGRCSGRSPKGSVRATGLAASKLRSPAAAERIPASLELACHRGGRSGRNRKRFLRATAGATCTLIVTRHPRAALERIRYNATVRRIRRSRPLRTVACHAATAIARTPCPRASAVLVFRPNIRRSRSC